MIIGQVFGDKVVIENLLRIGPRTQKNLSTFVATMCIKLQRHVKADKLTGQVLRVRTGTLRRSITYKMQQSNSAVTGIVGTNVKYAAVHEFGFQGAESVKAHLRMMKKAWGKEVKNARQIMVQAHSRSVNLPERSFLRSALNDMQGEIKEGMEKVIRGSLRGLL